MHQVSIKPQWSIRRRNGESLPARLITLLVDVHEHGSLLAACREARVSYRHAWQMVREGEALFGAPLLTMTRGKGSLLTPLAEKLVWADRRIAARLSPVLDSLASELEVEIERTLSSYAPMLRVHASHGFAIASLHDTLTAAGVPIELKYSNSLEAVAAQHDGDCELAGFHIPLGEFQAPAVAHYARWFDLRSQRVVHIATRRQGLMVERGNPRKLYAVSDLARPGVRFINRQAGSGTRFLLDLMLRQAGIEPEAIVGYEQGEYTHAAVAAYVASGMADVGFGVETPARRFKLDFIPLQTERYFLLSDVRSLETAPVREVLRILAGPEFKVSVDAISGYDATDAGLVQTLTEAFPSLAPAPRKRSAGAAKKAVRTAP